MSPTLNESDSAVTLSERIRRGMMLAKRNGRKLGRRRRDDVDPERVKRLRDVEHMSWNQIAAALRAGRGTVLRAYYHYRGPGSPPQPSQKGRAGTL